LAAKLALRGICGIMPGMGHHPEADLTPDQAASVDAFWARERSKLAAAAKRGLPWARGDAARNALARSVERERAKRGLLTKGTFDDVLQWGFRRGSQLGEDAIGKATG
jgi:hypothetical protein